MADSTMLKASGYYACPMQMFSHLILIQLIFIYSWVIHYLIRHSLRLYQPISKINIKCLQLIHDWGCRIHRLHLCRGVRPPPPMSVLIYDTKQSDGEVPAMLELLKMRSTPLLPLLPGPLGPGVVAPDRALFMGEIELTADLC